jgi:hypothetical protein
MSMTRSLSFLWAAVGVTAALTLVLLVGCAKGQNSIAAGNAEALPTLQNMVEPAPTGALPAEGGNVVAPEAGGQVPGTPAASAPAPGGPQQTTGGAAKGPAPRTTSIPDIDALLKKRAALKSYKMVATVNGKTVMTDVVKQAEGRPVRSKMTFGETGDWLLVLNDKNERYRYSAEQRVVMKLPSFGNRGQRGPGGQGAPGGQQGRPQEGARGQGGPPRERPQGAKGPTEGGERGGMPRMRGWMMDIRDLQNGKPTLKPETVDGVPCLRVDVKRQDGTNATYWLDTQYGLLRQSKIGDTVTKIKYEQINAVPDSAFELPAGVKVVDAPPGMMGFGGPGGQRPRTARQENPPKETK